MGYNNSKEFFMSDFITRIEEIEKMIDEGKLDEAKEAITQLMGNVNVDLNQIIKEISSN